MSVSSQVVPSAMTSAGPLPITTTASYSGNAASGIPPASSQTAGNGAGANGVNLLVLGGAGVVALGLLVGA